MSRQLTIAVERFPLAAAFVISRGARTEAVVVTAAITEGSHSGRGECVPYARYGESVKSVVAAIETLRSAVEAGLDRTELQTLLPAGAARNALDCALWDLDAKRLGLPAYQLAGLHRLAPTTTAFTLSVGTPRDMGKAARAAAWRPLLKIKLAGSGDLDRLAAVRDAAPDATLIVDANEGWSLEDLEPYLAACAAAGVALVEQPLPAGADAPLAQITRPVPVCADESAHTSEDIPDLCARYDAVNVKLDKAGGLTEALRLISEAERHGLGVLVGCMVASSLAMAPAMLLTPRARFVDLDGPLLLARDRPDGLAYDGSIVHPPTPALWG
ncbi:MAG TPA: N-acetyl-D-Glu racemase DgcA [Beijerinckiaceae bacterium]|jgi:L-alanine-DL-glutamate epimerase-like enolase superfamily enzyme|nr:N-acetyl-D-Glu racemase DgcA [Beijerinckiaceae bacterium]